MKLKTRPATLLIPILMIIAVATIILVSISAQEGEQPSSNKNTDTPTINLYLNGTKLPEIVANDKEIKYAENEIAITSNDVSNHYYHIELKGRGNSTWREAKKPFQIKFQNATNVLDLGKMKKWYLLANYFDNSGIRTALAFHVQKIVGEACPFKGSFVELYIDQEYQGLYFLTNAITISKNSINLRDLMGILIEIDNAYYEDEEYYITESGEYITIKDLVESDNKETSLDNFLTSYDKLFTAAMTGDWTTITKIADLDSFAKFYLYEDFIADPDAYITSYYFYQDGLDDKIHAGPGWDFDKAFDNPKANDAYSRNFHQSTHIFYYLEQIPEFQNLVRDYYLGTLRPQKDEILQYTENLFYSTLPALLHDAEKWGQEKWGFKPGEVPDNLLSTEIDYKSIVMEDYKKLYNWLSNRFDEFDHRCTKTAGA